MLQFLFSLGFWTFIIHQPLVVILRLLDAEITSYGVHGDEWLVEPFIQASQRLTQGIVFLNNDQFYCRAAARFINTYSIDEPFFSVTCTPSIDGDTGISQAVEIRKGNPPA